MADEPEKSGQEPNLELPSLLSFGRNRKRRKGDAAPDASGTEQTVAEEPVTEARSGLAPSADKAKRLPPVPPPTAPTEATTEQIPVPPPPPPPADEPQEVEEPSVIPTPETVPEVGPEVVEAPEVIEAPPVVEETTVLPIADPEPRDAEPVPAPVEPPAPAPVEAPVAVPVPVPVAAQHEPPVEVPSAVQVDESLGWPVEEPPNDDAQERPARGDTSLKLPPMNPRAAAVITGALVGFLGVLLAYFASRGCETVRGVGSCGGMGLLALLLIVAIEVVLGAILLKAWQISDPTSTSFLGVGLVTVFVLLFLLSSLESVWMILVIPVLSALTFLLSWWVTTAFVEVPGEDARR